MCIRDRYYERRATATLSVTAALSVRQTLRRTVAGTLSISAILTGINPVTKAIKATGRRISTFVKETARTTTFRRGHVTTSPVGGSGPPRRVVFSRGGKRTSSFRKGSATESSFHQKEEKKSGFQTGSKKVSKYLRKGKMKKSNVSKRSRSSSDV